MAERTEKRKMMSPSAKLHAAVAVAALLLLTAPGAADTVPTIGVDEVHRGQRGYGLSVFAGSAPERFEVEVLGVMRNNSPGLSYILARLTGDFEGTSLEETGVISGMSGSPVFLDDRLAGAVAFSWSFTRGAVAGITPIAAMRELTAEPSPERIPAAGSPPVSLADIVAREIPADLVERQLARLRPRTALGTSPLQWSVAGFGRRSLALLEGSLGAVAPAGATLGATAGGDLERDPEPLEHGSAVAAVLVDGDLKLAAAGTVTDRDGEVILAFGHPFLGLGPVRVPMATTEVITVVSNQFNSFKIANFGPRIGAFEQDRLMGIQGRIGSEAPMVPVTVRVGGEGAGAELEEYRMEVAALPMLTPGLVALSSLGSLEASGFAVGNLGLDLEVRFRLAGYDDLLFTQSFDGGQAVQEAVGFLTAMAGYLAQNELERVDIEGVEVDFRQSARPRTVTLTGAHASRTVVRPGETVTLFLDLLPYQGEAARRSLAVTVPDDVPDGRYFFFVGDGASIDAARLAVEPAEPVTFSQALRFFRSLHSRRQLGVLGVFGDKGLSVAGEVLPRLPGSVASIWGEAASGNARPLRLAVAQEEFETVDRPHDGLVRIDLEIKRPKPRSSDEGGSGAGHRSTAEESP